VQNGLLQIELLRTGFHCSSSQRFLPREELASVGREWGRLVGLRLSADKLSSLRTLYSVFRMFSTMARYLCRSAQFCRSCLKLRNVINTFFVNLTTFHNCICYEASILNDELERKSYERKRSWPVFRYYLGIELSGKGKITNYSQCNRYLDLKWNRQPTSNYLPLFRDIRS
jgi:hypothetical protein